MTRTYVNLIQVNSDLIRYVKKLLAEGRVDKEEKDPNRTEEEELSFLARIIARLIKILDHTNVNFLMNHVPEPGKGRGIWNIINGLKPNCVNKTSEYGKVNKRKELLIDRLKEYLRKNLDEPIAEGATQGDEKVFWEEGKTTTDRLVEKVERETAIAIGYRKSGKNNVDTTETKEILQLIGFDPKTNKVYI